MCRVIIMGPPGAGKGTQGSRLARQLDVPHIASGDILRQTMVSQAHSEVGKAAQIISEGHMVSDRIASNIVFDALSAPGTERGFVLDGYPRNVAQAIALAKFLKAQHITLDTVFALYVREEILHLRLSGRLTCGQCGRAFHRISAPPKVENKCDGCGTLLLMREDDDAAGIATRLSLYSERTKPVLEFYAQQGLLQTVEAEASADKVFSCLAKSMEVWYT